MRSNLAGLVAIGLRLGAVSAAVGLGVMALSESAWAQQSWQFNPDQEQLVIALPKGVTPQYYLMAEPARIVIDLPNTEVGTVDTAQSYGGVVRQIRVGQFQPGLTRIVMELSPNAVLAPGQVELQQIQGESGGALQRWSLRPLLAGAPAAAPVAAEPAAEPTLLPPTPLAQAPAPSPLPPLEPGAIEIPVEAAAQMPAQPSPEPIATTPTFPSADLSADSSVPIQVDFATPLPATSAELAAGSSAEALSSTSSRPTDRPSANQAASAPAASSVLPSGTVSFPVPTAEGVSVPALSTVVANSATDATAEESAAGESTDSPELPTVEAAEALVPARSNARQPAQPSLPTQAAQPAPAQPAPAQPATSPAAPSPIQVIPFGQPLPQ